MRLWHKILIPVLPRQQLLGQWRECCLIARSIAENGTPNHILVNQIMNFSESHFNTYALAIHDEMLSRGYKCDWEKFSKWRTDMNFIYITEAFIGWHNKRYLCQCYYNLQEKYDCGGISEDEFQAIQNIYLIY